MKIESVRFFAKPRVGGTKEVIYANSKTSVTESSMGILVKTDEHCFRVPWHLVKLVTYFVKDNG